MGEKDTLFKDRERPKTIPYSAARTYIAHKGEFLLSGEIRDCLRRSVQYTNSSNNC